MILSVASCSVLIPGSRSGIRFQSLFTAHAQGERLAALFNRPFFIEGLPFVRNHQAPKRKRVTVQNLATLGTGH